MKCPVCGKRIDDDCRYCDQCGVQLFRCPVCGVSGRGPVCVRDGTPIGRFAHRTSDTVSAEKVEALLLSNITLGIHIEVRSGDVLGRTEGRHAEVFARQRSVSGRHVELHCTPGGTWTITDLASTNGTSVDGKWIRPNDPVAIRPGIRIVLANVEFLVARA